MANQMPVKPSGVLYFVHYIFQKYNKNSYRYLFRIIYWSTPLKLIYYKNSLEAFLSFQCFGFCYFQTVSIKKMNKYK